MFSQCVFFFSYSVQEFKGADSGNDNAEVSNREAAESAAKILQLESCDDLCFALTKLRTETRGVTHTHITSTYTHTCTHTCTHVHTHTQLGLVCDRLYCICVSNFLHTSLAYLPPSSQERLWTSAILSPRLLM